MNKVTLVGRLCADPELKFTPGAGTAVTTFTLAVNRRFKKEGQPEADFIPVVVWGRMAEVTANYMSKGRMIGISGRIETRSYEAKDGTRRYVTEVIAEEVQFIGSKKDGQATEQQQNTWENSYTEVDDDDIPF
ncbi:single-stranded DNA-binding protein [Hathewaya histolytica]|uniref:Single-stranded DNA-binding protein n=1 Tax=Hathewaya histolytica TaxID=1498 RepID=A0A4U9RDK9_HATHI|nr:single-stranded DNA-binding protein [Hathewaya histolytica]VTQ89875.1 ssDNA-binding protein [Hathewaya histolytica]